MFARYRTFISCFYIVICVSPFFDGFRGNLLIYISLIIYIVSPIKSVKLCFHLHILLLLFFLRIYFVDSNYEYVFISNADKTNLIVSPLKNTSFFIQTKGAHGEWMGVGAGLGKRATNKITRLNSSNTI